MNTLTSSNINTKNSELSTVKPIILLERCFGIFRFRVEGGLCVPVNRITRIIGFFIYLINAIFCSIFAIDVFVDFNIARIAEIAPSLMIFFQYTVTIIMQLFVEHEEFVNLFNLLKNIDYSLRVNMDDDFYKKSQVETMKLLGLLSVSYVTLMVFDLLNEVEIKIEYLLYVFVYVEIELEVLFFYILSGMLRKHVVIINRYLSKFTTHRLYSKNIQLNRSNTVYVIEDCVNFIGRASSNNMRIRDLAETYHQIGKLCQIINRTFNLLLLTTFISSFAFIIITFWTSLYYFQSNKTIRYLLKIVVWISSQIIPLIVLAINCDKLVQAKEKTKFLVNQLVIDYDLPKGMRMQAKVFMEILNVWPLRIFVYDMFCTDIHSIFKLISLCASYLIVVIQINHFL
nr:gustatory receptor 22.2 [Papilio memnon]